MYMQLNKHDLHRFEGLFDMVMSYFIILKCNVSFYNFEWHVEKMIKSITIIAET